MISIVAIWLLAQWTHRYPKVEGYNHHVYLEGYELPVLNPGPSDPALPPTDGLSLFRREDISGSMTRDPEARAG